MGNNQFWRVFLLLLALSMEINPANGNHQLPWTEKFDFVKFSPINAIPIDLEPSISILSPSAWVDIFQGEGSKQTLVSISEMDNELEKQIDSTPDLNFHRNVFLDPKSNFDTVFRPTFLEFLFQTGPSLTIGHTTKRTTPSFTLTHHYGSAKSAINPHAVDLVPLTIGPNPDIYD